MIYEQISVILIPTNLKKENSYQFTLVGYGEHLINQHIGDVIDFIKSEYQVPLAVLTNGNMLYVHEVRERLYKSDILIPTLVSSKQETFEKITRPAKGLLIDEIIDGISVFSKNYNGIILSEIMLVNTMNTDIAELEGLLEAIIKINPQEVRLNTILREPAISCDKITNFALDSIIDIFRNNLPGEIEIIYVQ